MFYAYETKTKFSLYCEKCQTTVILSSRVWFRVASVKVRAQGAFHSCLMITKYTTKAGIND